MELGRTTQFVHGMQAGAATAVLPMLTWDAGAPVWAIAVMMAIPAGLVLTRRRRYQRASAARGETHWSQTRAALAGAATAIAIAIAAGAALTLLATTRTGSNGIGILVGLGVFAAMGDMPGKWIEEHRSAGAQTRKRTKRFRGRKRTTD